MSALHQGLPTPYERDAAGADQDFLAEQVLPRLHGLLEDEQAQWRGYGAPWDDALHALTAFIAHGKLLRPRFCYWGHAAVTDAAPGEDLVSGCVALELLHTFALIHDDVMDQSQTRRGEPSLHARLAEDHRVNGWSGSHRQYGVATGVLIGDLAFAMASRLASELGSTARGIWSRLVAELTAGQFLDLAGAARRDRSEATALTITRLKSARYTVTGPLQLGAALSGSELPPALARYGDLVGDAFQLRDDILGVYGDEQVTGKPVGNDLREGKPTLLLALGMRCQDSYVRETLSLLDSPALTDAETRRIADTLDSCGARAQVEQRIASNVRAARKLLQRAGMPVAVREALTGLADDATNRSS